MFDVKMQSDRYLADLEVPLLGDPICSCLGLFVNLNSDNDTNLTHLQICNYLAVRRSTLLAASSMLQKRSEEKT